jgi:hypothetical protein
MINFLIVNHRLNNLAILLEDELLGDKDAKKEKVL